MVTKITKNPEGALTVAEPYVGPADILDGARVFLHETWTPPWERAVGTGAIPVDMYEYKDELVIRALLRGFKREDIDVTYAGEMLTIRAGKNECAPEEDAYRGKELLCGTYLRTMPMPFLVDGEKLVAAFENGALEIRLRRIVEPSGK